VLVRVDPAHPAAQAGAGWPAGPVSFEQLVLGYLQREPGAATAGKPASSQAVTR
jgi:hypothetical protein